MNKTMILYSKSLNVEKLDSLSEQARRLGLVRAEVWRRYGALHGANRRDRDVRDEWMKSGRCFGVTATAWKETLRDVMDDIAMCRDAAKSLVKRKIAKKPKSEQKSLYSLLKSNDWTKDNWLHRQMRKAYKHGKTCVSNQIVVRSDNYRSFVRNGQAWIAIPGLERRKPVLVPLTTNRVPSGTLRVIIRDGRVEVHFCVDADVSKERPCGDREIGVDKGYTEALVDSDGDGHGVELGSVLRAFTDKVHARGIARNKLSAIAEKSSPAKRARIEANNLGTIKLSRHKKVVQSVVKTIVHTAVHAVVDKASVIGCEDLSSRFSSKRNFGKKYNRRMSNWTKGVIAKALQEVSQRRGSALHVVCAAYTSQMDSQTGLLEGKRVCDKFYHVSGDVSQADFNAALNVKARIHDPEIGRWTPHTEVRSILLLRAKADRLPTVSTRTPVACSTESEECSTLSMEIV